ncbi:MAG: tetratricopeptide repeat protein [bacterium]|nr:tetratricopeptide repeat protein [bacterium]
MFVSIGLLLAVAIQAAPADDFAQGNTFFQEKDFTKAIEAYTRAAQSGLESAPLYYNLGNAYFKNGDLGHAVLYYLKARRLDPADQDIKGNLEFARSLATVQLEGVQLNPINSLFESIVSPFRLNSLAWLSSIIFILLVVLLIIRFGMGGLHSALKPAIIFVLILLVCSSILTSYKYHHDFVTRWAVVVGEEVNVLSGPVESAGLEFQGEPGLVVRIAGESGDYYDVIFENQRRGWVQKSLLAEV